jgi:hypothetical protein
VIAQVADSESWPEAAIAIAGIAMVVAIAVVVIIQISRPPARMSVQREAAYRKLAEEAAAAPRPHISSRGRSRSWPSCARARASWKRMIKEVE